MPEEIRVEVVFALPAKQILVELAVPAGATVADVITASGIEDRFPDSDLANAPVGIWGKHVDRGRAVKAGDRVEIYRDLEIDPREARRERARAGTTMASTAKSVQSEGSSS